MQSSRDGTIILLNQYFNFKEKIKKSLKESGIEMYEEEIKLINNYKVRVDNLRSYL